MDVQIYIILFNSTTNNDLLYFITPNILPKSPAIADTNQSVHIFLDLQLDVPEGYCLQAHEGEIDIDEARELIKSYYQSKTQREPDDEEKQEADKVSANRWTLHIHATDEWNVQPKLNIPTSTPQVQTEHPTSTPQVKDKLHTSNPYILELIKVIGVQEMSVKEMLTAIGLKERKNFLNLYLNPAVSEGYVRLLYPNSPRHPRQKYLLTVKGLAVYDECVKSK